MSTHKAWRRCKRGTVCCYLFGVLAAQLILVAVVEWTGDALRDPLYQASVVRLTERRAEMPDRPLLLALGSSRTLLGLDAGQITRADGTWLAFNWSDLGAGPMLEHVWLRRLLADGMRPDLVLLELVPLQLATSVVLPLEETALDPARLTCAEMRSVLGYYRWPAVAGFRWLKANSVAGPSRQRALHDALHVDAMVDYRLSSNADGYGYFANYDQSSTADRLNNLRNNVERYRPRLATARLAAGPAQAFRDLVGRCRSEQLPFAVILMPECAAFRKLHTPVFLAEVDQLLAELQRAGTFPVIDARAWVADDGFVDAHHLRLEGANVFSRRLAVEQLPVLKHHVAGLNRAYASGQ
jgi:hypothetical protein